MVVKHLIKHTIRGGLMGDFICKVMGTIDLIIVVVLFFIPLWKPLKVILILKMLYTGVVSWLPNE